MSDPMPDTISGWFAQHGDFPENLPEDLRHEDSVDSLLDQMDDVDYEEHEAVRLEQESEAYEEWAAEHAADLEEAAYLAWAQMRMEDGMDWSRLAYEAHIDALVAASEPD